MKIYFDELDKNEPSGVQWKGQNVCFVATRPVIVQPSEIMKVPLNLALKIEEGCVLIVGTHPDLYDRVATLFPDYLMFDDSVNEKPLELAVRNSGRNPLHLMIGDLVAIGYLCSTVALEPEPFSISYEKPKVPPKSRPSKKNPNVEFEIT